MYNSITVKAGKGGWGGPLTLVPNKSKDKILCVTGGEIPDIANKIAEMTGASVVDGFKTTIPDTEVLVAIVDCGGTARCGVYPKKGILTINLTPVGAVGPLAQFIKESNYVSAVTEGDILFAAEASQPNINEEAVETEKPIAEKNNNIPKKPRGFIVRIGGAVGKIVSKFYAAGRETIDMVIKTILPFMAFTSMLLGIISASGLGEIIASTIAPLVSTLPGMIIISVICALPFLSPVLGPGAVIAQVVGTLVGVQIGMGAIPVQFALPALFAINAQVGADFVPVGLSLGESESETIELGVPAVLFSRLITGPLAVIIAFLFAIV